MIYEGLISPSIISRTSSKVKQSGVLFPVRRPLLSRTDRKRLEKLSSITHPVAVKTCAVKGRGRRKKSEENLLGENTAAVVRIDHVYGHVGHEAQALFVGHNRLEVVRRLLVLLDLVHYCYRTRALLHRERHCKSFILSFGRR